MFESSAYLLSLIKDSRVKKMQSRDDVLHELHHILSAFFVGSSISLYLFDQLTQSFLQFFPADSSFSLSEFEKSWALKKAKQVLQHEPGLVYKDVYLSDRTQHSIFDSSKLSQDQTFYNFACLDLYFIFIFSEQGVLISFACIHDWANHKYLSENEMPFLDADLQDFIVHIVSVLDTISIHHKITSLLSEEVVPAVAVEDAILKERILELTVLHDTSNALAYEVSYELMVKFVFDAMLKVLKFDVAGVCLYGFSSKASVFYRLSSFLDQSAFSTVNDNMISALSPFLGGVDVVTSDPVFFDSPGTDSNKLPIDSLETFFNLPLIFKKEVLGILHVSSHRVDAFSKSEMNFLHTLANQLSVNLERLKIAKKLENSRMSALIYSMDDAVIVVDNSHHIELINAVAKHVFSLDSSQFHVGERMSLFDRLGILDTYQAVFDTKKPVLNHKIEVHDLCFSVNINPVLDDNDDMQGIVLVFRDITDMLLMDKIKTQRLEVISKVNLIIKSITDLDNLLIVLMEFILNVSNAEMGSILLKQGDGYICKIHSNFPEKIRRMYHFLSGESLSDAVIRTKELCFIDHYMEHPKVSNKTKVLLDWYLAIPIFVQNELIGIVNIAKKCDGPYFNLSSEDINTLTTITNLSGTAIHNAMLFDENLEKQKLDQELKIANEIQSKLLPSALPIYDHIGFAALSVPAREIGGDYYDFFKLDSGEIGIVLADIVGKGIPAGLFMAMLKSILSTHLPIFNSPKKALEKINEILLKDHIIDKFIPIFYGILNVDNLSFTYSNAGHEPVLHYSQSRFTQLDTQGFPLAAFEQSAYEEKSVVLQPDDVLLFFTDGIVEMKHLTKGSFGLENLKRELSEYASLDPDTLVRKLYQRVQQFSEAHLQQDDLTLLALQVFGNDSVAKNALQSPLFTKEVRVTSHKKYVSHVRKIVAEVAENMGFPSQDIYNLKLAVNEAHANIIEHAYFERDSGDIVFSFFCFQNHLKIVIRDYGTSIDRKSLKLGPKDLIDLEGSGLGLYLIRTFIDKLEYIQHTQGTELILIKFLKQGVKYGNT